MKYLPLCATILAFVLGHEIGASEKKGTVDFGHIRAESITLTNGEFTMKLTPERMTLNGAIKSPDDATDGMRKSWDGTSEVEISQKGLRVEWKQPFGYTIGEFHNGGVNATLERRLRGRVDRLAYSQFGYPGIRIERQGSSAAIRAPEESKPLALRIAVHNSDGGEAVRKGESPGLDGLDRFALHTASESKFIDNDSNDDSED